MTTDRPSASIRTEKPSPYAGRTAVLATMHGKERAIAPVMEKRLRLSVTVPANLNTDALGTFSGEIERPGDMHETAVAKARLAMQVAGVDLGIASEGSYGPHPIMPFVPLGRELIVLVDDKANLDIREVLVCEKTNFRHVVARAIDEIDEFLGKVGFPGHGLIVRPNRVAPGNERILKGIQNVNDLDVGIKESASVSSDGTARIETDMRAHQNPTRMAAIADAANLLASRVETRCPACEMPGFGRVGAEPGLPCTWCAAPTQQLLFEVYGCGACDSKEKRPRTDGVIEADPGQCDFCNP